MNSTLKYIRNVMCVIVGAGSFVVCSPTTSLEAAAANIPSANCVVQPSGVISPSMAEGFRAFWSLYVQIATAENIDAILIAPIHYREHFGRDNPSNGQGIFQLYSLVQSGSVSFPDTDGQPVADEEFIRQGRLAMQLLKGKVDAPLDSAPPDDTVKSAYYGYNGRNRLYASQARPGQGPWDGSPYVMNNPGQRELIMMTHDGGSGPRRVDKRPGAWTIYEELRRQCSAPQPPTVTPATEGQPSDASTAGLDVLQFLNPNLSPGGKAMKEFTIEWQPIHMDGELTLVILAGLCALAAAWLLYDGKWKRPEGILLIGTLASAALAFALLADQFGRQWSYDIIWQNLTAIVSAIGAWLAYPPRVTAVKTALVGMLIINVVFFSVRLKTNGRDAFSDIGRMFKPLLTTSLNLLRKIMGWRLLWTFIAAIFTLIVAASRLQGDVWMYGSSISSLVGITFIFLIVKKSKVSITE